MRRGGIRDDLIRLSDARGRIAAQASGTQSMTMAAVNANKSKVLDAIARRGLSVSVANLNAPDQTIIAGSVEAIEDAVKILSHETMRVKPLAVTAAFHCGAMASAGEALAVTWPRCQRRRVIAAVGRSESAAGMQAKRPPISGAFLLVAVFSRRRRLVVAGPRRQARPLPGVTGACFERADNCPHSSRGYERDA